MGTFNKHKDYDAYSMDQILVVTIITLHHHVKLWLSDFFRLHNINKTCGNMDNNGISIWDIDNSGIHVHDTHLLETWECLEHEIY